jgi:tRNA pseudouridine55 synthase
VSEIDITEGGFLLIDKPLEWTSFDVVKKLRNISKIKKIGHAGTLDPLATGLLIVCYGKYTKKIEYLQAKEKEYIGSFEIGKTTPSFDLETAIDGVYTTEHITPDLVLQTVKQFTGEITQIPPQHSAVKIKGKRAYEHARAGKEVQLRSRIVTVSSFDVDTSKFPTLKFNINCSKGTYIRSLARDLGKALNSGAYMSSLRRTKIGEYDVIDAVEMKDLKTQEDFFKVARQLIN